MARKAESYWEKRNTELMKRLEKQTEQTIQELVKVYHKAQGKIQKEIEVIFNQYATNGKLNKGVAQRLLTKKEQSIYYDNLLKTIKLIKDKEIQRKLLAKYNAPAYQARITRLQALQENIYVEVKKLAEVENEITKKRYESTIKEAYYRNMYEIQHGLGVGFSFAQMDTKMMQLMLAENWMGKQNYSKRIWGNTDMLAHFLQEDLTASIMSGTSVQKIARNLNDTMNKGLYNATRLVRTEVNHFANEAEMLSYEEAGIEEYQFIATLDNVTCGRCTKLDKQVFKVKDRKAGKNYPPIHANDRCTTVAVFDDEKIKHLLKKKKDENGNDIEILENMNYQEWYNKYSNTQGSLFKKNKKNKKKENPILLDITSQRENLINTAFINKNIKRIAMNADIEEIKLGGKKAYYINRKIVLKENYTLHTIRHEIGHAVDYNNNQWLSSNENFLQAISKDKRIVLKNRKIYKKLIKNNLQYEGLSDIIGGITKNKIKGKYGHDKKYWKRPNALEKETFAQLFDMAGKDDFEQLQIMQKYFPNIFREFDNIIRRLL